MLISFFLHLFCRLWPQRRLWYTMRIPERTLHHHIVHTHSRHWTLHDRGRPIERYPPLTRMSADANRRAPMSGTTSSSWYVPHPHFCCIVSAIDAFSDLFLRPFGDIQIFDAPSLGSKPVEERWAEIEQRFGSTDGLDIDSLQGPQIKLVKHLKCQGREHLTELMQSVEQKGGEG